MALDPPIGFIDLDKLPQPPRYRVLLLSAGGEVTRMVPILAYNDTHAEQIAKKLIDVNPVELWDGVRLIECFKPSEFDPKDDCAKS